MTHQLHPTLHCDGKNCGNWIAGDWIKEHAVADVRDCETVKLYTSKPHQAKSFRKQAAKIGWSFSKDKDYCGKCTNIRMRLTLRAQRRLLHEPIEK